MFTLFKQALLLTALMLALALSTREPGCAQVRRDPLIEAADVRKWMTPGSGHSTSIADVQHHPFSVTATWEIVSEDDGPRYRRWLVAALAAHGFVARRDDERTATFSRTGEGDSYVLQVAVVPSSAGSHVRVTFAASAS